MNTAIAPCDDLDSGSSPPTRQVAESAKEIRDYVKLNQILPRGPTIEHLKLKTNRNLGLKQIRHISFCDAFGPLGIPVLFISVVCLAWSSWLIFIALAPNEAANWLMNTGAYDNGRFWYISDPNPTITLAGVVGLVVVALCYLLVILRMIFRREKLLFSSSRNSTVRWSSTTLLKIIGPSYKRGWDLWNEVTSYEGKNRKRWNAFLKLVDLAMETAMLRQLLQSGSPTSLAYGYAAFLAVNSLSCIVNVLADRFSALTEITIDSIFDLSAAVLFPILTLVYSYYNFDFDREVYLTYLEKLPAGSFEHNARSFADPSEIALFQVNFDSLRIRSLLDFTLRISMNLALCFRFERVLEALVWTRYREYASRGVKKIVLNSAAPISQNPVPKTVTAVFLAVILVILMSTHKAIADSAALCATYHECVVYAHRWETSDKYCPCLILINVDLTPKTYDEWFNAQDATNNVKALAGAGLLTSLQVINRQLVELPEEIRKCSGLKTIQLVYTDTQHVPVWAKDLRYLETIHIEGRYGNQNLLDLPDDLFADLPHLSMIHLGIQQNLRKLPSFTGVPNLQSLSLAWATQLQELPSFEHVPKLSRLVLSLLPRLDKIPDLAPLENLVDLVVYRPSHLCCNGFVGSCDLTHVSCLANVLLNTTPATCLTNEKSGLPVTPYLGSTATKNAFNQFAPFICQETIFDRIDFLFFPSKETIDMCSGIPFRQCQFRGNIPGICYNTRFQVLACLPDPAYIALRKLQIEKEIGPKCDPVEEKWLGCDDENNVMRW